MQLHNCADIRTITFSVSGRALYFIDFFFFINFFISLIANTYILPTETLTSFVLCLANKGWTDFCAIRKVQIIGNTTNRVLTLNVDTSLQPEGDFHHGNSLQPISTSPDLVGSSMLSRPWQLNDGKVPSQLKTATSVNVDLFGSSTGVNSQYSFLVASRKHRGRKGRKKSKTLEAIASP